MAREHSTIERIQLDREVWASKNFPDSSTAEDQFLGMAEELGELAHAMLKFKQNIRGYQGEPEVAMQKYETDARDAVGDLCIFLMGLCTANGWSLQDIIEETWEKVSQRDWTADPEEGDPDRNYNDPEEHAALADTFGKEQKGE